MSQAGVLSQFNLTTPITVPDGGTGNTMFPAHTVLLGEGTSAIGNVGPGAANTILMGQGASTDPVFGTLIAGSNVTLTPGATSITISAVGGAGGPVTFNADSATIAMTSGGAINTFGDATQGISILGDGAMTLTFSALDASVTQKGVSELATSAETIAGTDTVRTVTPEGLNAKLGTQTLHGVILGGGSSNALSVVAVGATNQVLLGVTGADPIWGTVPNGALTNSSITLNNGSNITVTGSPVSLGGAATINVSGTTNHSLQLGNAGGSLTSLGVAGDGFLPIGSSGADPVLAQLTAGTGISIVNAAGSITISSTSGASVLIGSARNTSTTAVTTSKQCALLATTPTTSNTDSLISINYTAASSSNILEFDFSCPMGAQSISACSVNVFLFKGSTVIAGFPFSSPSGQYLTSTFKWSVQAGTTSSQTYTVRWANSTSSNPIYALCYSGLGTPLFNATGNSKMTFTIKEYTA